MKGKWRSWGFFSLALLLTGRDCGLSVSTTIRISFPFSYSYGCIHKKTRASLLALLFLLVGFCQCSQFNLRHKCNGLTLAWLESNIFMRIKEKPWCGFREPTTYSVNGNWRICGKVQHGGNWGALNGPYLMLLVLVGILFIRTSYPSYGNIILALKIHGLVSIKKILACFHSQW